MRWLRENGAIGFLLQGSTSGPNAVAQATTLGGEDAC